MPQSVTTGESRPSDNHVVRFRDACDEIGVKPLTMRRWIAAGRGPHLVRLSSRVHGFRRGEVFPDLFPSEQAPVMRALMARALKGEIYTVTEEFDD